MMKRWLLALVTGCLPVAVIAQGAAQNAAQSAAVLRADTLRAEPFADAKAVAEVPAGGKLQLLERKGTWANAEYQGRRGWLEKRDLLNAMSWPQFEKWLKQPQRPCGAAAR